MFTYLFYDIETSGLNKCFDQVLQFAAIRTDSKLNEIVRFNILLKLNPDTVPSPQAFLTHQISLHELEDSGITEYEAIVKIHQLLNEPNTISIGYNNLGFDDEFLRFSFYRNLLTPYTHQYANGCRRMDLYPMTVMYYLFKPDIINWPTLNNNISLKLERLNNANQLMADGNAHDAMHDVIMTLELARRFFTEQSMWDYLCGYFDKNIDLERFSKLQPAFITQDGKYYQALMIKGSFAAQNFYQISVLYLGTHNHYKNQYLWLQLDDPKLQQTSPFSIAENTFVIRKRLGEPPLLLPISQRFMRYLSKKRIDIMSNNLEFLKSNQKLLQEIIRYHKEYKYPEVPNLDLDAALYQIDFLNNQEIWFCNKFHAASLKEKIAMLGKFPKEFLRNQAIRLLGRNYRENLPEHVAQQYDNYLAAVNPYNSNYVLVDYRNEKRLTPREVLTRIKTLKAQQNLQPGQLIVLDDLEKYLTKNFGGSA